jgi:hypothetical protein
MRLHVKFAVLLKGKAENQSLSELCDILKALKRKVYLRS